MGLSGKRQESMVVNDAEAVLDVLDVHERECREILSDPLPLRNGEARLRAYAVKRLRHIKLLRARMPRTVFKA